MAKVLRPSDVKTKHPLRMDRDLAVDLYAFCAAQTGSKKNPIICRAIRELIKIELDGNALLNQRFQEARAQLVASPVTEMRLVTPKSTGTG
jgi:hypothetical protein